MKRKKINKKMLMKGKTFFFLGGTIEIKILIKTMIK